MATAKRTRSNTEAKELKLVCKCGSCTHWEIVLSRTEESGEYQRGHEYLICVNCGLEVNCYFSTGPHEGLHYEKHVKGDEKPDGCTTGQGA